MNGHVGETLLLILEDEHRSPVPEGSSDVVGHNDMDASGDWGAQQRTMDTTNVTGPADAGCG